MPSWRAASTHLAREATKPSKCTVSPRPRMLKVCLMCVGRACASRSASRRSRPRASCSRVRRCTLARSATSHSPSPAYNAGSPELPRVGRCTCSRPAGKALVPTIAKSRLHSRAQTGESGAARSALPVGRGGTGAPPDRRQASRKASAASWNRCRPRSALPRRQCALGQAGPAAAAASAAASASACRSALPSASERLHSSLCRASPSGSAASASAYLRSSVQVRCAASVCRRTLAAPCAEQRPSARGEGGHATGLCCVQGRRILVVLEEQGRICPALEVAGAQAPAGSRRGQVLSHIRPSDSTARSLKAPEACIVRLPGPRCNDHCLTPSEELQGDARLQSHGGKIFP